MIYPKSKIISHAATSAATLLLACLSFYLCLYNEVFYLVSSEQAELIVQAWNSKQAVIQGLLQALHECKTGA